MRKSYCDIIGKMMDIDLYSEASKRVPDDVIVQDVSYRIRLRRGDDMVEVAIGLNELQDCKEVDILLDARLRKALWVMDNPGEPHCLAPVNCKYYG